MTWVIHIVDDDMAVRTALHYALDAVGFQVSSYVDAADFLAGQPEDPFLLICDLRMPGTSGIELARLLRKKGSAMPIILMTGHADDTIKLNASGAGADAVLEKPVSLSVLLAEITRLTTEGSA
jgi:two-component system, LuxR family, response regulator FixJ